MAESFDDVGFETGSQSDDSHRYERLFIEPFDAFICPLTKQLMRDPVTLETGHTFERESLQKWFAQCTEIGKKATCPVTGRELQSTEMTHSIGLRKAIDEWAAQNYAARLDIARRSLTLNSLEKETLHSLKFVHRICRESGFNKQAVLELMPLILDLLKSSSHKVRCMTLETLLIISEADADCKGLMAEGDTVRTILKFLSNEELSREREEAISLLHELSTSDALCEKIGSVNGSILILIGITNNMPEKVLTVEKAVRTLENLGKCGSNVRQMAENGRLEPLLCQLLSGTPEAKLAMASYLGELVLNNDEKISVASSVGSSLIDLVKNGNLECREASLKALNQISSCEASSVVLIELGILPPLMDALFSVGPRHTPMRLKEVSATILSNIVRSGYDFESMPVGSGCQTLVSEGIVHSLLHLISDTGPAIEGKLLQVLVGLTSSPRTVMAVVSAIKSSGASFGLVQFIEAPQMDLREASIKLLKNLSPHMGQELADALRREVGQLGSLVRVIMAAEITDAQVAAVELLADLSERDLGLTGQMLNENVFHEIISRVVRIRQGDTRGARFATPYFEGLSRVLATVTRILHEKFGPAAIALCQEHNVPALFVELLQFTDGVQVASASALENLSRRTIDLTGSLPEPPPPGYCASVFSCFAGNPAILGECRIHHGICSLRESFCLCDGQAVEKLVSLLDHETEDVAEAALAALSTLLDDGTDTDEAVNALCEKEAIKPVLNMLVRERCGDSLRRRAIWAIERYLRNEDIAREVAGNVGITNALVDAFKHGDVTTHQIAERALKHVDRLPNFSSIF